MAGLIDSIEQKTGIVGQNRMEMLLFRLPNNPQLYGLNVFKILEIVHCPHITILPKLHQSVIGVIDARGITSSVIDLSFAMGGPATRNLDKQLLLMTEYNKSIQGFVVNRVERIVDISWDRIKPAPQGVGQKSYLVAVTEFDHELVEIIDVEKILSEISPDKRVIADHPDDVKAHLQEIIRPNAKILVADDSKIALKQTVNTIKSLGLEAIEAHDGKQALDIINKYQAEGKLSEIELLISDVEMPELDGYSLSAAIRRNPLLKELYVILHTSISGVFNESMLKRAGANGFIAKFDPEILSSTIIGAIESLHNGFNPAEGVLENIDKAKEASDSFKYDKSKGS